MFDFKDAEEQASGLSFVTCGIHDFKVLRIFYQPVGESVGGETKKDGSFYNFTKEQIRVEVEVFETHAGGDCKGAKSVFGVLDPTDPDPKKHKGRMDRIMHIFCNMTTSDKKDAAKEFMRKINVKSMKELAKKLAPLAERTVRLKFIANQEGTFPQLPNYYAGFAECTDVPFEKSILKYDESKEGVKKKDSSKVENAGQEIDLFASQNGKASAPVGSAPDEEDLPF